ncbi:type II toxin-antitoxin system RelE/ParE family toxin, partial [Sinorhizobium medicae]|nr:type II toxin-antitoxin system RelE/ParE family toxin [Sinorhizobium medicae]
MKLEWTSKAVADLGRLYDFLAPVNRQAAARTVQSLTSAPARLLEQPR